MQRRVILIVSLVLVLMLSLGIVANAFGPFMGGARGPRMLTEDDLTRPYQQLELTAEQRENLAKINEEFYQETVSLREELQQLHFELQQMALAEKTNEQDFQEKLERYNALRRELHELQVAKREKCQELLTEEQKEKIKSFQKRMNRGGGGRQRKGR